LNAVGKPAWEIAKPLDVSTRLAFDRTRLAHDRTMMAWVRTATSMISFGFTIYKFFQLDINKGVRRDRLIGPREFALMLIAVGLGSLLVATIQHRRDINELKSLNPEVPLSLAALLAGAMAVLGILAFVAVLLSY
jgi:putative membrane protein